MQKKELLALLNSLEKVLHKAQTLEEQYAEDIEKVHPAFYQSARNLIHYLGLRHTDIRATQKQLSLLGLSSLGRSEKHVLPTLQAVWYQLQHMLECNSYNAILNLSKSFAISRRLLKTHTKALMGPLPTGQSGSIMVTMDADMASDVPLVKKLLTVGMNCARINCAHDDETTWGNLVQTIRQASAETGISCRIFMDLAGPKLRTGLLMEKPKLLQLKPRLNVQGALLEPAHVWLAPPGIQPPDNNHATLPVPAPWLEALEPGRKIKFEDVRGRKRSLWIIERHGSCVLAQSRKNAYISSGTALYASKLDRKDHKLAKVGQLPPEEVVIRLFKDDMLILHSEAQPGEPAKIGADGTLLAPAHVACTLPEILADVKPGERVLLNDGKIEGVVMEASQAQLSLRITFAKDNGSRLRGNKSINFPDSNLRLHGLTDKDRQDLAFVVQHADVINVSFVQTPADIEELFLELKRLQAPPIGVLLKIETKRAFQNLPLLLLTLMQHYPAGIMIARGDLAVEVGWNRLAEVQEEILWLCEAAHLPVVWATQVLENLAKKGRPSRAEITDAAMSQRAECVMLNKGPHILETISTLRDIMKRMQGHQSKKTSMLRSLKLAAIK